MTTRIGDVDCAINTNLVRYNFKANPVDPAPKHVNIRVLSKSKPRSKEKKLADLVSDPNTGHPPFKPTDAEVDCTSADPKSVGLWVGMRPNGAERFTREALTGYMDGQSVQSSSSKSVTIIPHQDDAVRVIVPPSDFQHATFFALINPDAQGLCEAVECKQDEVFYFEQYRNDQEKSLEKRKANWNRKIIGAVSKASRPNETWPKSYDKEKFQIPAPDSRRNEIVGSVATYLTNPKSHHGLLERALSLLNEEEDDRTEGNEMIIMLAGEPGDIEETDCKQLKAELEYAYLGLGDLQVTSEELFLLCQACHNADIQLLYAQIRAFVVAFVLQTRREEGEDHANRAKEVLGMVAIQLGTDAEATPALQGSPTRTLIRSIAASLKDLLEHSVAQTAAVADSQGDHAVAESLPKLFEKWGATFDVDQTKLYAAHVHRFLVYKVLPTLKGDLEKGLAERIKILEECDKGVKD